MHRRAPRIDCIDTGTAYTVPLSLPPPMTSAVPSPLLSIPLLCSLSIPGSFRLYLFFGAGVPIRQSRVHFPRRGPVPLPCPVPLVQWPLALPGYPAAPRRCQGDARRLRNCTPVCAWVGGKPCGRVWGGGGAGRGRSPGVLRVCLCMCVPLALLRLPRLRLLTLPLTYTGLTPSQCRKVLGSCSLLMV